MNATPVSQPDQPADSSPRWVFYCQHCGVRLMLTSQSAVTSGPCPSCGQWLTVPSPVQTVPTGPVPVLMGSIVGPPPAAPPAPAPPAAAATATRKKARILADLTVDAAHLDRRETTRSLVVIGMFILTACVCAVVFYLMLNWAAR